MEGTCRRRDAKKEEKGGLGSRSEEVASSCVLRQEKECYIRLERIGEACMRGVIFFFFFFLGFTSFKALRRLQDDEDANDDLMKRSTTVTTRKLTIHPTAASHVYFKADMACFTPYMLELHSGRSQAGK